MDGEDLDDSNFPDADPINSDDDAEDISAAECTIIIMGNFDTFWGIAVQRIPQC
jgi:hypothetical protein